MNEQLRQLVARRWRIGAVLTGVMMAMYFGFILLVAFGKDVVSTLIGGRVSVGIIVGAVVILVAPALTAIYVRWANRHYDRALDAHRKQP
jgi:uncharacterized membrane protein (DUF485 family)